MHAYVSMLYQVFLQKHNEENALAMKAYMKNHFEFIGIKTPARRLMSKQFMRQHGVKDINELETIVRELWQLPERELQYFAIELLGANQHLWNAEIIELITHCIVQKSWWDTVDALAIECTSRYFKVYSPLPVTAEWNQTTNIWLQRSSLLFQKNYKQQTDTKLLSAYIENLATSDAFFVQKAIGWMLREYAKTNVNWVVNFVELNALASLSKREALKHVAPIAVIAKRKQH